VRAFVAFCEAEIGKRCEAVEALARTTVA